MKSIKKPDEAEEVFRSGITRSSAVFSTFAEENGLPADVARKIACGFGAGVSKTGNMCGAVSGAILAIGLKYGKSERTDTAANEKTRALVREFIAEFIRRNGSITCTELLGYNLANPDEYQKAAESGLFLSRCPRYVRDAADILERIL
ncbi:MAG TPA: C-GCAxxG-C-C family protein [Methanolinea sp.]|nr:C-GCAxxG-C-C family protein [Methanolinea sp.]